MPHCPRALLDAIFSMALLMVMRRAMMMIMVIMEIVMMLTTIMDMTSVVLFMHHCAIEAFFMRSLEALSQLQRSSLSF